MVEGGGQVDGLEVEPTGTPVASALSVQWPLSQPGPPYRAATAPVDGSIDAAPTWTSLSAERCLGSRCFFSIAATDADSAFTFFLSKVV
ncbi:hypothetical protein [Streptomyces sp. NPDC096012]|uniref:hypothetical protein n=1 Tax=Streptomyces sp. NPDC096012 TaxID=3155684 RepID=UPI00336A7AAC